MEQQLEQLSKAVAMAETSAMGLLKSHVKQYTRQDGTVVQEHEDSRIKRLAQKDQGYQSKRRVVHHEHTGRNSLGRDGDDFKQHASTLHEMGYHKKGSLVHMDGKRDKNNSPAVARWNNHYVMGNESAVWQAHRIAQKKGFNVHPDEIQDIKDRVKKKTGHDIEIHSAHNLGDSSHHRNVVSSYLHENSKD
jgi:hypothetical protein